MWDKEQKNVRVELSIGDNTEPPRIGSGVENDLQGQKAEAVEFVRNEIRNKRAMHRRHTVETNRAVMNE